MTYEHQNKNLVGLIIWKQKMIKKLQMFTCEIGIAGSYTEKKTPQNNQNSKRWIRPLLEKAYLHNEVFLLSYAFDKNFTSNIAFAWN